MGYAIAAANLKKAQEMYKENNNITYIEVANVLGYNPETIKRIWSQITGIPKRERSVNSLVRKARQIYKADPLINPETLAKKVGRCKSYITSLWEQITGHPYKSNNGTGMFVSSVVENIPISLQIPDFVPKAKPFVDRNGKEYMDVSEFFGIVENGGECYKNVRYTIPKGDLYNDQKV